MAAPESAEDTFRFRLNAQHVAIPGPGGRPLGPVLREEHGLVSIKLACDDGSCRLCSVLVDGEAVRSCLYPLGHAAGHVVVTAEGLHTPATLNRIQRAFLKWGVPQCGFCAPAMLIVATELLGTRARPSDNEIRAALSGILCRCTGYRRIVAAVAEAVGEVEMPLAPAAGEAVGHDVPAIDGRAKVTGSLRFAADAIPEDALWLRLVPAHRAPARISVGGFEPLLAAHPELATVLTANDLPPALKTGAPPLADGRVAYRGEPVAALIGRRDALTMISDAALAIHYEPLAQAPGAGATPFATAVVRRGEPEQDFAAAACVAEAPFAFDPLAPAPIAVEAGWAEKRDGGLDLHLPPGDGHGEAWLLAEALGLAPEKVRVVAATAGGCFGVRDRSASVLLLGLAAWKLGRPVALMAKPLAPAAETPASLRVKARLAADREGRLLAAESDSHLAAAASDLASSFVAGLASQGAAGPYAFASASAKARAFAETAPMLRASRGLGAVEATLWREALMDDLAGRLGLDRLQIRCRNAAAGLAACFDALAPHWQRAVDHVAAFNAAGRPRHGAIQGLGLGVAGGALDCGVEPPEAWVRIALDRDGRLRLTTNGEETGQGLATMLVQIAADALGLAMSHVIVELGASLTGEAAVAPQAHGFSLAPPQARQIPVTPQARGVAACYAVAEAAAALRHQLLDLAKSGAEARLELTGGMLRAVAAAGAATEIALASLPADGSGVIAAAEACKAVGELPPAFAVHLAVVEVDPSLGAARVMRVVAAQDFGGAIHPAQVAGQIEGAVAQAVGYALMAPLAAPIDGGQARSGAMSPIPPLGAVPVVELVPIAPVWRDQPKASAAALLAPKIIGPKIIGPKIIGPWAVAASAAAILSALRHATGLPIWELPATPDRLRAQLGRGDATS